DRQYQTVATPKPSTTATNVDIATKPRMLTNGFSSQPIPAPTRPNGIATASAKTRHPAPSGVILPHCVQYDGARRNERSLMSAPQCTYGVVERGSVITGQDLETLFNVRVALPHIPLSQ